MNKSHDRLPNVNLINTDYIVLIYILGDSHIEPIHNLTMTMYLWEKLSYKSNDVNVHCHV